MSARSRFSSTTFCCSEVRIYFSATADTTLHLVILQNSTAFLDQPIAHIPGETADVRLLFGQAEDVLHPSIGVFLRQDPVFPDPVKGLVSADPFVSQFPVSKGAKRYQGTFVDTDIGVAFGIVLADIQMLAA